ncbi:MAG: SGNH/GDSL hydrolase family protein [Cyclobacteriaceae bacterium]|nr:SGNH/GDSL hydrolase family protein [Cyclobacteriaceae bacterium]
MLKTLKLIAINGITFLVLLAIINLISGLSLKKTSQGNRSDLPNYANDREHAREIFVDYNRVQHQYEPFTGWKTLPYSGKTLQIDQSGIRTHKPYPATGDTKTVYFFGGSTMWGEGSDDQHTIPALVNQSKPDYETQNHAQLAYATRQELDALITLYSKNQKPDYVIFYDGVNESAFLCPTEINELPAHRLVPMFRQKLYQSKKAYIKELLGKLFYENIQKVIYRYTYKPSLENTPYNCASNPEKARALAHIMMRNWEIAHDLVAQHEGNFIAILQPAAFIGNPKTDHLKLDEQLRPEYEIVYKEIRKLITERGYDWIYDFTDSFDLPDYIYIDFCHVSPNGNEIIARRIASLLP